MGSGFGLVLNKSTRSREAFVGSNGIGIIINGILIIFIFLRIISIIRTAKDIISRTNNSGIQIISILIVTFLTPIFGLPLYHIIRPVYYKRDRLPRREACALNLITCGNCGILNAKEHECCISCGEPLKIKCKQCGNKYQHTYSYCNHCGAPNIE
ncbi:MAG: hypothetical protein WC872_01550 [Candidatus Absconditabacterales bacterium]